MNSQIFTIRARKCLRCGRLLTSKEAVENGYGCRCMELADKEKKDKEPIDGQMNIMDFIRKELNGKG